MTSFEARSLEAWARSFELGEDAQLLVSVISAGLQLVEPVYSLPLTEGSPGARSLLLEPLCSVLRTGELVLPRGASTAFAEDHWLGEAESYVGFVVRDREGQPIGFIELCSATPDDCSMPRVVDPIRETLGPVGAELDWWARETRAVGLTHVSIDELPCAAAILADDGSIVSCNPRFAEFSGRPESELLRRSIGLWIQEDDWPMVREALVAAIGGVASGDVPVRLLAPNGPPSQATMRLGPVADDSGSVNHVLLVLSGPTPAHGLDGLETLAGGVAHDFNNIIAAVLSHGQLALASPDLPDRARENVQQVVGGAMRAKALISQLLSYSRIGHTTREPVSVGLVAHEALGLIRSRIPATIRVEFDAAAQSFVYADPTSIHQVSMNLLDNAIRAMRSGGGVLTVRVLELPDLVPGAGGRSAQTPHAALIVSDTGSGMTQDVQKRAFEPFFTTRSVGEGSGLGLAVVHGLVHDLGGVIQVESAPDKGTTVSVFIPLMEGVTSGVEPTASQAASGTEHVLLVDDDAALRRAVTAVLEHLGYRVSAFASGFDALERLRTGEARPDVLVTDLRMPGLAGDELCREVRVLHPSLPVIVFSGTMGTDEVQRARAAGAQATLSKPMGIDELGAAIRSVLTNGTRPSRDQSRR